MSRRKKRGVRLELTPLMDVMFLVLVFFIYCIFDMAVHKGLKVDLPRTGGAMEKGERIVVTIKADDYFVYGNAEAIRLQEAITALPAKQQLAFNLRYYDELSYREIAAVTDSTEATVKANYHFAKEKIIKYMNSNDI